MTTQPQPGQWWQSNNDTQVFIIGVKQNGDVIFENKHGQHFNGGKHWHNWQHLPDCDSFDWQPEVWPKYYTHKQGFACDTAYLRRDSAKVTYRVSKKGHQTVNWWDSDRDEIVSSGGWIEITEAEAKARINPPSPPNPGEGWRLVDKATEPPKPATRTVVLREWLLWSSPGHECLQWLASDPLGWPHRHPTGQTRTIEVPE